MSVFIEFWVGLPLTSSLLLEYSSEYLNEYSLIPEVLSYKPPMTKKGWNRGSASHGPPKGQGLDQA